MAAVRYLPLPGRGGGGAQHPIQTTLYYPPKKEENGEGLKVLQETLPMLHLSSLACSHSCLQYPSPRTPPLLGQECISFTWRKQDHFPGLRLYLCEEQTLSGPFWNRP